MLHGRECCGLGCASYRRTVHERLQLQPFIEDAVQTILEEINSQITTIPGIGARMGAMILAEVGDAARFDRRYVARCLPIRTAFVIWNLLTYGKARLQILALCPLQRSQMRLPWDQGFVIPFLNCLLFVNPRFGSLNLNR